MWVSSDRVTWDKVQTMLFEKPRADMTKGPGKKKVKSIKVLRLETCAAVRSWRMGRMPENPAGKDSSVQPTRVWQMVQR